MLKNFDFSSQFSMLEKTFKIWNIFNSKIEFIKIFIQDVPLLLQSWILGCLRVKYFTLPIGDMNSPSYNKFTEGIDFFWQAAQTLVKALKSWKISIIKIHILCQNSVSIAQNEIFNDNKVERTIFIIFTFIK